jgi:hypothetical protein
VRCRDERGQQAVPQVQRVYTPGKLRAAFERHIATQKPTSTCYNKIVALPWTATQLPRRIGKKLLACTAGIVPLVAGLGVVGSATAAHAENLCIPPIIINDDAIFADSEISAAGLVPEAIWLDGQSGLISYYLVASTNPAPYHLVPCGSTMRYTLKYTLTD